MSGSFHYLQYGSKRIEYLLLSSARKTLEIAVHPDSSVVVKAPSSSELAAVELKLRKRARWILKQLRYFQQFVPRTPERRYISGETHLYLGRRYQLKVVKGELNKVKLARGAFIVSYRNDCDQKKTMALMENWYSQKALQHFNNSFIRCWVSFERYGVERPDLKIRRMKNRWGSLSNGSSIILNPELIKAPSECIDYVVTHELCHLLFNDHSRDFYNLLGSVMPNWERIKRKLEFTMA
ncbi:MAG: metal-dependent hydrolase [Gemmatimonadaceae bacterium 4484_173]|nr:MAG: metal-dependent hydrolase [Gemmatimonadaceae bacterium 4484_173]RKZ03838.1 MAG: M48 family peptidase [Candidatus Fermentibacteria bacterium]